MNTLIYTSPIGDLRITSQQQGYITAVDFCEGGGSPTLWESATPLLKAIRQQLEEYFYHQRTTFTIPFAFISGTPFQRAVWRCLLDIPYGETRTYQQIAIACQHPSAYRAVGQAIHCNPLAILVPCHRVIGKNGSLTGYAAGTERKQYLLCLEAEISRKIALVENKM